VGDIVISPELLWSLCVAIVAFIILGYFFKKTKTGLRMRAVSEDHSLAMSAGLNITLIFGVTWIIAVILGTLSGMLLGNRIGLAPTITPLVALRAFPAVIFGGLDSIIGAIVGGRIHRYWRWFY
jgi:branched-chain amino acid transport system permease protein